MTKLKRFVYVVGLTTLMAIILAGVRADGPVFCWSWGMQHCEEAPNTCVGSGECERRAGTQSWYCLGEPDEDSKTTVVMPYPNAIETNEGVKSRIYIGEFPCAIYYSCGCTYSGPGEDMESSNDDDYFCNDFGDLDEEETESGVQVHIHIPDPFSDDCPDVQSLP